MREFEKTRSDLQACDTQSAHRTLQQVNGREDEHVKHILHSVASGIVKSLGDKPQGFTVLTARPKTGHAI